MAQTEDKISAGFALSWLRKNLKKKGVIGVADFAVSFVSDYLFDFRYGTTTGGWIPPFQLQINSSNIEHSVRYQATKTRPFRKLLKRLSFPKNSVFVDVGAGTGKALLIASRYGFERLSGIEFAHDLCRIARTNVAAYRQRSGCDNVFEIIESDVVEYDIRGDENVFYLYNPFDEVVLRQFLNNIKKSVDEYPRKVWLIYHIPRHSNAVEDHGLFAKRTEYFVGGTEFVVYESEYPSEV
jgi:SAM-dependent methyltransferase